MKYWKNWDIPDDVITRVTPLKYKLNQRILVCDEKPGWYINWTRNKNPMEFDLSDVLINWTRNKNPIDFDLSDVIKWTRNEFREYMYLFNCRVVVTIVGVFERPFSQFYTLHLRSYLISLIFDVLIPNLLYTLFICCRLYSWETFSISSIFDCLAWCIKWTRNEDFIDFDVIIFMFLCVKYKLDHSWILFL